MSLSAEPVTSADPVLLVVAGMPCAGKSTVLRESLTRGTPLFGEPIDGVFRSTGLPRSFPENDIPLPERLSRNTWIHELDLFTLRKSGPARPSLVVHFDLFLFLLCACPMTEGLRPTLPDSLFVPTIPEIRPLRTLREFIDLMNDAARLRLVFGSLRQLVRPEVRIHSVTLEPAYGEVCARWRSRYRAMDAADRAEGKSVVLDTYVYDGTPTGERMFATLHDAWSGSCTDTCERSERRLMP